MAKRYLLNFLLSLLTKRPPNQEDLKRAKTLRRWSALETAKRHLLYSLLSLRLPIEPQGDGPALAFRFVEDRRSNPLADEEHVNSGHLNGMITINMAEADPDWLVSQRQAMNEPYRTLLGHFRHESGHYYWERLIRPNNNFQQEFSALFGDATTDYAAALAAYYARKDKSGWGDRFISAYCQAHPLEDWAECWAHYLHLHDGLETAACMGMLGVSGQQTDFDARINQWSELTTKINAVNRSLGLDSYPFTLSDAVRKKLAFIDKVVGSFRRG